MRICVDVRVIQLWPYQTVLPVDKFDKKVLSAQIPSYCNPAYYCDYIDMDNICFRTDIKSGGKILLAKLYWKTAEPGGVQ